MASVSASTAMTPLYSAIILSLVTLGTSMMFHQVIQDRVHHPDLSFVKEYEVVVPTRIISGRHISDLSTKLHGRTLEHDDSPSFSILHNGKRIIIDLKLHRSLVSGEYTEIYFDEDGNRKEEKIRPEACFYHGVIRGSPDSYVVVSTCDGLRGHISAGPDTYHIEPHPEPETVAKGYPAHVVYHDDSIKKKTQGRCGHNATNHNHNQPRSVMDEFTESKVMENRRYQRATGTITKYNQDRATRYVELFLVFDYNAWLKNPNRTAIRSRAITITSTADSIFKPMNVRVILTGVQIWNTGNPVTINATLSTTLDNFCEWRKANLKSITVPHDLAHLIVGLDFEGTTIGYGIIGRVCQGHPCAIIQDDTSAARMAFVLAHEIGHNLGMQHDDGRSCSSCSWGGGCVMSAKISPDPRSWTQCSINDMNEHPRHCLSNYPTTFYADPICGNGLVEKGEECDCGSASECPTVDPCCETTGCKLKPTSECGTGACCESCKFMPRGTVCRNASNECDIYDMCTGSSNVCPADNYKPDGTSCKSNQAYCLNGDCITADEQCRYWFGPKASQGDLGCYNFNARGDKYGNCGETKPEVFKECASKDYRCGKLHCSHPTPGAIRPIIPGTGTSLTMGTLSCKSAKGLSGDVRSAGLVLDGTKCGEGKMCFAAECKTLVSLAFNKTCPVIGGRVCAGNGDCTQTGECSCHGDYNPRYNCEITISAGKLLRCYKCSDDTSCWRNPNSTSAKETCTSSGMVCQVVRNDRGSNPPFYNRGCVKSTNCAPGCRIVGGKEVCTKCCNSSLCNNNGWPDKDTRTTVPPTTTQVAPIPTSGSSTSGGLTTGTTGSHTTQAPTSASTSGAGPTTNSSGNSSVSVGSTATKGPFKITVVGNQKVTTAAAAAGVPAVLLVTAGVLTAFCHNC